MNDIRREPMNDEKNKSRCNTSVGDPRINEAPGENAHVPLLPDPSPDLELKSLLHRWSAPEAPAQLDRRVMESYRRWAGQRRWWRRIFSTRSLPARVMAATSLCLLILALIYLRAERKGSLFGNPPREALILETEVRVSGDKGEYITYINQSGFQPVQPVRVQILRRSKTE